METKSRIVGVKILLVILAAVVGGLILLEGGLRLLLGLGNPPLYLPDEAIGYLLAPNQELRRFGNRIAINQYSMRTHRIEKQRQDSTLRIFLLGDSIANGGWWTDQEETISALIRSQLQSQLNPAFDNVEVLNASANSWGPRNEAAYLRRFGTFEAQVIVLLLNTDDLFAKAPTSLSVGRDRNYPTHKPPLGLIEFWQYFFYRSQLLPDIPESGDRVEANLKALAEIQAIANQANAQFILGMTPLLRETEKQGPRDYEKEARQRLEDFSRQEGITYLDFLPLFQKFDQPELLYRDHIHLSKQGNQLVSETISQSVKGF